MTLDDFRTLLADPVVETRRQAVIKMGETPIEGVSELVLEGLGDADWRVRKEAVRVATELAHRDPAVIDLMVQALCDGDNVGRRNAALEVLGHLGPDCADALLEALPRAKTQDKKFIVDALGDAGAEKGLPALIDAAANSDPNISAAALDALARVGGPGAEGALRHYLPAKDPFQQLAALDGLVRLNATVPWQELEPLLGNRMLRRVALGLLGRTGRGEAAGPLISALGDASPHVVADATRSLTELSAGDPSIEAGVADRLASLSEEVRGRLRALMAKEEPDIVQSAAQLLLLAQDEIALPEIVRLAAEDALPPAVLGALRLWGTDAVGPLLSVYQDAEGVTRGAALELGADLAAEGRSSGKDLAPLLLGELRATLRHALATDIMEARLAAVRSLTLWAEPADAPSLVAAAVGGSEEMAHACADALRAIAESSPEAVWSALQGTELKGTGGAALASVLAETGGPEVVERLQTALSADDPGTRRAAVEALAQKGGQQAAELVGYALTDEHLDVQTAAARALGRLRDAAGRPVRGDALLLSLESESPSVQAAAARALGDTRNADAIEPLRELVRSKHAGVAVAALEALRVLRDPTLGDLLVEALGHPDPEVVKQALAAIREAGGTRTASRLALGLEHTAWDVRALAARLLGEVGGEEALRALRGRSGREADDLVRAAIDEALEEVGGTE